jgi:hypothetical protein
MILNQNKFYNALSSFLKINVGGLKEVDNSLYECILVDRKGFNGMLKDDGFCLPQLYKKLLFFC